MRTQIVALCLATLQLACGSGSGSGGEPASAPSGAPAAPEPAPAESAAEEPEAEPKTEPAAPPEPAYAQEIRALLAHDGTRTASVGSPIEGSLQGGVTLPLVGPGFRFNPAKDPESRYGTVELVQALVNAATAVHEQLPGNELTFGDLSRPEGGDIQGHASHQAGRDVDVLFYLLDAKGEPFPAKPIPLDLKGEGTDYRDLAVPEDDIPVRIDVPRTWAFVAALLAQERVYVQRIFVVEHIRAMLMDHARKTGADAALISRFGDLTCQPGFPHDDHMHIRLFCAPDDIESGCRDMKPIYPWHKEALAAAGVSVKMAGKRTRKRKKLTSTKEARAKAGPMHEDVVEFLDRREAWVKRPHPGRPYCK